MGATPTNDPKLRIGSTDDGSDVFVNPSSPLIQRLTQQAGGQNFWSLAAPAAQLGIGLIQADTANLLKSDIQRRRDKIDRAQDFLKTTVIPNIGGTYSVADALNQLNGMFSLQQDVNGDELKMVRIERDMALYQAGMGAMQLASQFSQPNVAGYVPGPDGSQVPVLATGLVGLGVGYELGQNGGGRRGGFDSGSSDSGDVRDLG